MSVQYRAACLAIMDIPSAKPGSLTIEKNKSGLTATFTVFGSGVPCKRFHVLSNSLFKVLFNFPSPYLFAIGLVPVFSLRWSLPPTLGCILKQPDSRERQSDAAQCRTGLTPALGKGPDQGNLDIAAAPQRRSQTPQFLSTTRPKDSVLGSSRFTRRY